MAEPISYVPRALLRLPLFGPIIGLFMKPLKSDDGAEQAEADSDDEPDKTARELRATALREGIQKIRDDLAAYGTALGLLAGTVTAATVITTFDALFPVPNGFETLFWVAVALLVTAATSAVRLTQGFFSARRRVLIDTKDLEPLTPSGLERLDLQPGLDQSEKELVRKPLEALAIAEGSGDFLDLERRVDRLERVAATARLEGESDTLAAAAQAEAKRLSDRLHLALIEGALSVIERRSAAVYRRYLAAVLTAVSVGGLLLLADWSKGQRDQVTEYNTCIEKAVDSTQEQVCQRLDPRLPTPTPTMQSPPGPSTSSSPSPSPSPGPIQRLNACVTQEAVPGVPTPLRDRALAECAGLPAVATASPPAGQARTR